MLASFVNQNVLEYHHVNINQDLTPTQRDRLEQLKEELKHRRDSGERVSIRGSKIVGDSQRRKN